MNILVLIVLGLCFGSFVNALVWRVYQQSLPRKKQKTGRKELSLSKGRSMCVECGHKLSAADLLPVVSWIALRGRCRYCKKPISWQYPVVELTVAVLFVASYFFWPEQLTGWELVSFGTWLACLVGLTALVIYDIRWMLLPNRIVFPLYSLAALFVVARMLSVSSLDPLFSAATGVLIGGGIFYVLFQASGGRWIGGGDVKLGFLLGALVGGPTQAMLLLFLASLLGTIVSMPLLATKKLSRSARIPFGPFLIAAAVIVQLFGAEMTRWYIAHFIDVY